MVNTDQHIRYKGHVVGYKTSISVLTRWPYTSTVISSSSSSSSSSSDNSLTKIA